MIKHDEFTSSVFSALNGMLLDMLAAIARKDYVTRRDRAAQGVQKAQSAGKYKGRKPNNERNLLIKRHLKTGVSSWSEIMDLVGRSKGAIAKQEKLLKGNDVAT